MRTPPRIAFHDVEGPGEFRSLIEEKAAGLGRLYGRITGCRVVVDGPHRRCATPYRVRLGLAVPGGEVVVDLDRPRHGGAGNLAAIIREAFDIARRRLEGYVQRRAVPKRGRRLEADSPP